METLRLGDSSVRVPPLAVGTMFWGTRVPADSVHPLLDQALDAGASFIDTANNYAFWQPGAVGDESESCLGEWIERRGPAGRDRMVLATKVGARPARPGTGLDDVLGLGRDAVHRQVADSLSRLRTDHVDLLYAHIDDTAVPLEETLGALQEVVDRGQARAIAASNLTAERLTQSRRAAGAGPRYVALQNRMTYLPPVPDTDLGLQVLLDDATRTACREHDVTMIAYSTLLGGAYTRPDHAIPAEYQHPGTDAALRTLNDVARDAGLDAGQTVLSWLTHRTEPVVPVVGVSRPEQLASAITAVTTALDPAAVTALEQARREMA